MKKTVMDKIQEGRQFRTMPVMECRAAGEDGGEESFIVEGYAATFGEPYLMGETEDYRFMEQIDRRAFDSCEMKDVIFQYDHEGPVFARKSNGTLEVSVDDHGLKVRADLGGTEDGRKLYRMIKGCYVNQMSFAFTVSGDEELRSKDSDGKTVFTRTITGIRRLYDVSAVSIPANDGTEISARSYFDGLIEREKKEAERLLEETERRTLEEHERERKLRLLQL